MQASQTMQNSKIANQIKIYLWGFVWRYFWTAWQFSEKSKQRMENNKLLPATIPGNRNQSAVCLKWRKLLPCKGHKERPFWESQFCRSTWKSMALNCNSGDIHLPAMMKWTWWEKCALSLAKQVSPLGIPVRNVTIGTRLFIRLAHLYDLLFGLNWTSWVMINFGHFDFFFSGHGSKPPQIGFSIIDKTW